MQIPFIGQQRSPLVVRSVFTSRDRGVFSVSYKTSVLRKERRLRLPVQIQLRILKLILNEAAAEGAGEQVAVPQRFPEPSVLASPHSGWPHPYPLLMGASPWK